MIKVFLYHPRQVLSVLLRNAVSVVIFCLVDIPMIDILVHHIQSDLVTGLKECFRTGIVSAAHSVVAAFF